MKIGIKKKKKNIVCFSHSDLILLLLNFILENCFLQKVIHKYFEASNICF